MLTMLVIVMIMVITHIVCAPPQGERFMRMFIWYQENLEQDLNNPEKRKSL